MYPGIGTQSREKIGILTQIDLIRTKSQQLFRLVESHDNKNKKESFGHCP